jgi:hypothetical protein
VLGGQQRLALRTAAWLSVVYENWAGVQGMQVCDGVYDLSSVVFSSRTTYSACQGLRSVTVLGCHVSL